LALKKVGRGPRRESRGKKKNSKCRLPKHFRNPNRKKCGEKSFQKPRQKGGVGEFGCATAKKRGWEEEKGKVPKSRASKGREKEDWEKKTPKKWKNGVSISILMRMGKKRNHRQKHPKSSQISIGGGLSRVNLGPAKKMKAFLVETR